MTLAIAHKEGATVLVDAIREAKPPFSPEAVTEEFAKLLKSYRLTLIYGDRYAGSWYQLRALRKEQVASIWICCR
jgi:hypothetical protein